MLRSRKLWESRQLHPVARPLLLVVVGVLLAIAVGFIVASGSFTRYDLIAVAMYLAIAAFAWHPLTAAFIAMLVGVIGVVFTNSGGDLIELALAACLVAATCSRVVMVVYAAVLVVLTVYLDVATPTLTEGGIFGIAGIAVISFIAGVTFRIITVRESLLVDDRVRLVRHLEGMAREDQERIADELHDGIAHDLTLVLFHACALPKQPDAAGPEVSLATIEESSTRAMHSVQSLLALMRDPSASSEQPPDENVTDTVVGLGRLLNNAGIPTVVKTPSTDAEVPALAQRLLGAAAIEAVTNVIKHAPHSSDAAIEVTVDELGVELVVKNSNSRASSAQGSSLGGRGLARARQRLEQHNGHLEAGATNNSWIVRADVPLHPPRDSRPVTS